MTMYIFAKIHLKFRYLKVGSSRNRVADILKPVLIPITLAEAVQAISKVAKNVAFKRFPLKYS